MRYAVIAFVILCSVCVYLNNRVDTLEKENARLESEKNALILNIEEYKKNELEANNTIKNLRKKISDDKEAFDWYNQPIPPAVLNELYKD